MNSNEQAAAGIIAMFAGMGIFFLVFALVIHLFVGYCFKLIAEKTGNEGVAGLWWIPIANLLIPIRVAKKPTSWFWIVLLPIVIQIVATVLILATQSTGLAMIFTILTFLAAIATVVVWIMTWMAVAEARGFERWWGIIAVFFWFIGIPYIAFATSNTPAPAVG